MHIVFNVLLLCGGVALCGGAALKRTHTGQLGTAGDLLLMLGLSMSLSPYHSFEAWLRHRTDVGQS